MRPRGSVYKRNGTWTAHVKWPIGDGEWKQRKKGGFRTRAEAEQHKTDLLRSIDLGVAVPTAKMTVGQWFEVWLDHQQHVVRRKPSTIQGYRHYIKYLEPVAHLPVQRLTSSDLDSIYRDMAARGLKSRTIRQFYAVCRKALGDAQQKGIVAHNPATHSSPPSTTAAAAPELPTWTFRDLGLFLNHIEGRECSAAISFAALSGCRRAEVCGLRWRDVDLNSRQVIFTQTVVKVDGKLTVDTPKSHRSRPIGLDDHVIALLRRHRAEQNEQRLLVGSFWSDLDLVFPDPAGGPLDPDVLSRRFKTYVSECDVPAIRLHDLRHTHATLLIASGHDPKLVSQRLGHATVGFTLDRYVKSSTDAQIDAANDFARRLRGTS